jgi:hypothetical protein
VGGTAVMPIPAACPAQMKSKGGCPKRGEEGVKGARERGGMKMGTGMKSAKKEVMMSNRGPGGRKRCNWATAERKTMVRKKNDRKSDKGVDAPKGSARKQTGE